MPMGPEFQGSPAFDPTIKPFTRRGMSMTSKNFIKFTRSGTGSEWARVSRNVGNSIPADSSTDHPHITTRATEAQSASQITVRFEETTLENSTSMYSDFEGRHTTTSHHDATTVHDEEHHGEGHEEHHGEGHEEHHDESPPHSPPVNPAGGGPGRDAADSNPPFTEKTYSATTITTIEMGVRPENTVSTPFPDADLARTRLSAGDESTAGTAVSRPPITIDSSTVAPVTVIVTGFELAPSTKRQLGDEATDGKWGGRPVFPDETSLAPPITFRDEFIPRSTTTEGDPRQFGGEFLPPDWTGRTSRTTVPPVTFLRPSVRRAEVDPWLQGVFRIRKTAPPPTPTLETTRYLFNRRFATSTTILLTSKTPTSTSTTPETTPSTTVTERQTEETSTETATRRKRNDYTGIPFGFFPFLRTTLMPGVLLTVLAETSTSTKTKTTITPYIPLTKSTDERQTEETSMEIPTRRTRNEFTGVPFGFFPFLRTTLMPGVVVATVLVESTKTTMGQKDATKPSTTPEISLTTITERQTGETSMEIPTRRTRNEFTGVPFGFFPFLRTTVNPVFLTTVPAETSVRMSTGQKDTRPPFGFFDIFKTTTIPRNTVSSETYTSPPFSSTEQTRPQTSTIKMTETILSSTLTTSMSIISPTSQSPKNVTVDMKNITVESKNSTLEYKTVSGSFKWLNVTSATPQSTKLISTANSTSALMNSSRVPALNTTSDLSTKTTPKISATNQSKIYTETTKITVATATQNTQTIPASQNVTLLIQKDETSQTPNDAGATKTAMTDNDGPGQITTDAGAEVPPARGQPRLTTDDTPNVQTEVTAVAAIVEQSNIS
jgi:hypothetical protein